jgi:diguanylate cyclase (GGDEF)-like protein
MKLTTTTDHRGTSTPGASPWWAAVVAAGLAVIFEVDRVTGPTPFQHLYYLPIILAGFVFEMVGGVAAAVAAVVAYHVANPHLHQFVYGESDIVQIVLFLAVGVVTATLTRDANRLRRLAATDDLTGLHNLRSFEAHLRRLIGECRAEHAPLAMLVLDLDRLKSINDVHGHLAGAEAVRTVGHLIGAELPPGAVACRYGGDEFAVVVPRCRAEDASRLAGRLCDLVSHTPPALAGRAFPAGTLSISIGTAHEPAEGDRATRAAALTDTELGVELFRQADAALYRAKGAGRNRVASAPRLARAVRPTLAEDPWPPPDHAHTQPH